MTAALPQLSPDGQNYVHSAINKPGDPSASRQLGPDNVLRINALADGRTFFLLAHGTSYFVAKRSADGTPSTYGTDGEAATGLADIIPGWLPMGVTTAGQVIIGQSLRNRLRNETSATFRRLGANGSMDASFSYADYRPNNQDAFSYDLLAKQGGGAIAFVYVDTHTEVQDVSPNGEVTASHSLADLAAFTPLESKAGVYFLGYRTSRVVGRLSPSLDLDTTFGTGGIATLPTPPPEEQNDGYSIAIDGSDRVIVASFAKVLGSDQLVLARFTTSGKLDTSFSSSGYVTFPADPSPYLRVFTVDGERMIVVGRYGNTANISRFWM